MSDPSAADDLFYIDQAECVSCGACQAVAPDLIEYIKDNQQTSRFRRQPESPGEVDRAIAAVNGCCVGCIYYRGNDPVIIRRIADPVRRSRRIPLMLTGSILFAVADMAAIFDPHVTTTKVATYFVTGLAGVCLFVAGKARL